MRRLPPPSNDKPRRAVTEEIRTRILQLADENPRWDKTNIARKIKGTEHEVDEDAVGVVLRTRRYRDK